MEVRVLIRSTASDVTVLVDISTLVVLAMWMNAFPVLALTEELAKMESINSFVIAPLDSLGKDAKEKRMNAVRILVNTEEFAEIT